MMKMLREGMPSGKKQFLCKSMLGLLIGVLLIAGVCISVSGSHSVGLTEGHESDSARVGQASPRVKTPAELLREAEEEYGRQTTTVFIDYEKRIKDNATDHYGKLEQQVVSQVTNLVAASGWRLLKAHVMDVFSRNGHDHDVRDVLQEELSTLVLQPLCQVREDLAGELRVLNQGLEQCRGRLDAKRAALSKGPIQLGAVSISNCVEEVCGGDELSQVLSERMAMEVRAHFNRQFAHYAKTAAKWAIALAVIYAEQGNWDQLCDQWRKSPMPVCMKALKSAGVVVGGVVATSVNSTESELRQALQKMVAEQREATLERLFYAGRRLYNCYHFLGQERRE